MAKRGTSTGMLVGGSPDRYERPKPSITVTEKDLPEIKKWEVGKKYKLEIEVEMVRHSQGDEYGYGEGDSTKKHEARLRITKISAEKNSD